MKSGNDTPYEKEPRYKQPYLPPEAELFIEGHGYLGMMPILRATGFVPISPAQVFSTYRKHSDSHSRNEVWNKCFQTGTAIAGTDREVILEFNSLLLREATPKTELTSGGIPLPLQYTGFNVKRYNRSELRRYLGKPLPELDLREDTPIRQFYLDLAEGDADGLDDLITKTFRLGRDTNGLDRMMGLFVDTIGVLRALTFYGLPYQCGTYGGNNGLDHDHFDGIVGFPKAKPTKPLLKIPLQ